jgi:hypothetical protein
MKSLLLIVVMLASFQWFIVPILVWQNDRVALIEDDLSILASREALVGGMRQLERNAQVQQDALVSLADLSFEQGPTGTLDMQRWVTASLENRQLMIEKFEWSPATSGPLAVVRAKVDVRGSSEELFEWVAELQSKTPWLNVLTLQFRPAGRQRQNIDMFAGSMTIQFILSDDANG